MSPFVVDRTIEKLKQPEPDQVVYIGRKKTWRIRNRAHLSKPSRRFVTRMLVDVSAFIQILIGFLLSVVLYVEISVNGVGVGVGVEARISADVY